jgi:predicted CXXCH cytochrome family protein
VIGCIDLRFAPPWRASGANTTALRFSRASLFSHSASPGTFGGGTVYRVTSHGEIALVAVGLALAALVVLAVTRGAGRLGALLVVAGIVVTGAAVAALHKPPPPGESTSLPRASAQVAYVSSTACRGCHPGEHASFSRTFHRTMTQKATPASVLAPVDGRPLEHRGRVHRLERRDGVLVAALPDPDVTADATLAALRGATALAPAPDVERRVVLATGSHREQVYWVEGRRPGELRLFPFVWLIREARFVPRAAAFLTPEDAVSPPVRWNSNCIACHAVAGEPGHDPARDAFDTRVAELGIACEACHGPGARHVERHRDPFARYLQRASTEPDRTIVNPARLSPERAAAVCGQCHSYAFPRDEDEWWASGYARSFRAGDALEPSRSLVVPSWLGSEPHEEPTTPRLETTAESLFWPDGEIRVGGREHNGLVASACYARGEGEQKITCTSCHSMHRGEPAGQLAPDSQGDRACTSCHEKGSEHVHHAAGSPGAACVGCHMPKTSYALYAAVRSHRIDSPRVATGRGAKPNACNLCHLDRSAAWAAGYLADWYGGPRDAAESRAPAVQVLGLSGDAAVRALVADALGGAEAMAAGGTGGAPPVLAELLADPYAAVRFVAARSLQALPGYEDVAYDFLDLPEARLRARDEVRARYLARGGAIDDATIEALLAARDSRPITIAE